MCTCIPELPGSYKVKKSDGRGRGRWVIDMVNVVVPLA